MYYATTYEVDPGRKALVIFPNKKDWEQAKSKPNPLLNEEFMEFVYIDFVSEAISKRED